MLVFQEGGKPENPEKNPQSKARTNNKLNPHMVTAERGWGQGEGGNGAGGRGNGGGGERSFGSTDSPEFWFTQHLG